jgi:tetrahydromethanopterin S-methyltransferase subunit G
VTEPASQFAAVCKARFDHIDKKLDKIEDKLDKKADKP